MNKNDLRYIKTERLIKSSFEECVKKYGFEGTTVSCVCEKALISRNTFYIHFEDKYCLLDSIFKDFEECFSKTYAPSYSRELLSFGFGQSLEWYVKNVNENRSQMLFLLKCSRKRMEDLLQRVVIDMPISAVVPNYFELSRKLPAQLNIKYMFSAMVSFTELWLENYNEISLDEVTKELGALCETPTKMFLAKILNC